MKLIKEIISKTGVLHFQRFAIFQSKFFSIYIHKIYKEDLDSHCHNHPWNIWTMILKGSYVEQIYIEPSNRHLKNIIDGVHVLKVREIYNVAYRDKKKYHKILRLMSKQVTTLALVFGKRTDWGYIVEDEYIDNITYRKQKNNEV